MGSSIESLAYKVKQALFQHVDDDIYSFVSPSAYDTAWVAMIPGGSRPLDTFCPRFEGCLDWVLKNQNEQGFWGDHQNIDCLPATLACMVALRMWNAGSEHIDKGLAFIYANAEKLLLTEEFDRCYPHWFAIVFPAMLELARAKGLQVVFPDDLEGVIRNIFHDRQKILEMERFVDGYHYSPLMSYLEALPSSYHIGQEDILQNLSEDGSLFQSPSATAQAFMATEHKGCIVYLKSVVQRCGFGVPPAYPVDEELMKLCMVNHIQRLGLAEHFLEEFEDILAKAYRNYMNRESKVKGRNVLPAQIYKDSLAFRLLRMQGYCVSPWNFCWFLCHEDMLVHIEKNCEYFTNAMFNVYRATDLMFSGEHELEEARSFSRKFLDKAISLTSTKDKLIGYEMRLPWLARLDHLDHRMWIEENETHTLWMGKGSIYRLSRAYNDMLMKLAMDDYKFRQSVYQNELEELKRWSKDWGLADMGFGREKTTYCYFAIAASASLPYNSDIRKVVAKAAVLITVADDFFDMKGSLDELKSLTEAVRRWKGKDLKGHSKMIYDALDNFVSDIAMKHFDQQGHDITRTLRNIWYETFVSWLTEAKWSRRGYPPSTDEYIENGMISIAAHIVVLSGLFLMNPCISNYMKKYPQYETITKLVMVSTRLLNDIQSYQKEQEDGKMNLVLLHLKENPDAGIEDSISYIKMILDKKKKNFLEHVLVDDMCDMPKSWKQFHLSALKVFQMFFNSSNGFDSETEMIHDINKAIYLPLKVQRSLPGNPLPPPHHTLTKRSLTITSRFDQKFRHHVRRSLMTHQVTWTTSRGGYGRLNKFILPQSVLGAI